MVDLIITPENCPVAIGIPSIDDLISDHFVVTCRISEQQTTEAYKSILTRNFRDFDIESFWYDLNKSTMLSSPLNTLDELVSQYNSCLRELLDQHAPVTKRKLRSANHKGWYIDALHSRRQYKRALQQKYNKLKDPDGLTAFLLERDNLNMTSRHFLNASKNYSISKLPKNYPIINRKMSSVITLTTSSSPKVTISARILLILQNAMYR